jgi:hypothetical protein
MSNPGDSFTEVTRTSWGSRLGQSIIGVLIGIVLVIASIVVLFWNEGRAVQTAQSLGEGAAIVVNVEAARVDPANESKLVHVTGDLKAGQPLRDQEFGVTASGLRLVRQVEMYQWKEERRTERHKNLGGSEDEVTTYSYHRVWSDSPIDSGDFRHPDGHQNPPMRYRRLAVVARDARLGAFQPGEQVLRLLPAREAVHVDPGLASTLQTRVGGPVQVIDGNIYIGNEPGDPHLGDLRISYELAPNGTVSIIGRQTGSDLTEYQTQAGDRLLMAEPGVQSAAEMFKEASDENRHLTWILRAVGAVTMFAGFALVLRPLVVVADVVPFIGSILGAGAALVALVFTAALAPLVIALAWLWYRPLLSIAALAVGFAIAFGLHWLARRKALAKAQPAAA